MPNLKKEAKRLAAKGRRGDTHLMHISADELMNLMASGKVTHNPDTGLPEAYNFGDTLQHWAGVVQNNEPNWMSSLPRMPGSAQSLTDALAQNEWGDPYGSEANSIDTFLGGSGHPASSEQP